MACWKITHLYPFLDDFPRNEPPFGDFRHVSLPEASPKRRNIQRSEFPCCSRACPPGSNGGDWGTSSCNENMVNVYKVVPHS